MNNYKFLLFDVDDTLLDFKSSEKAALQSLFEEQRIPFTETIAQTYSRVNQKLWQAYEMGEISRETIFNTRFSVVFEELGQAVDGEVFERHYRHLLGEGHDLIDGSLKLIQDLSNQYDCYVVTNGVSDTQYRRLTDAQLLPYFEGIFVSEDTGFQKPMKAFFDHVFARIPHFDPERALIIGDSLTSDIQGGINAGINTCWFNPEQKENHTAILPTYEIQHLSEIYSLLAGNLEKHTARLHAK